jgi:hypothetical protein
MQSIGWTMELRREPSGHEENRDASVRLGVRASPAVRRILAFENVHARPFTSAEMVEIDRASVCVRGGSSGSTHLFSRIIFYNMKT